MIEFVKMDTKDIARCVDIYIAAFEYAPTFEKIQEYSGGELTDKIKETYGFETYFIQCIEQVDKYALCMKDDDVIVGFITAWDIPCISENKAIHIDTIAVDPEFQKKGYGTKLIEYFISTVSKENLVTLDTKKSIPAFSLYKKLGFIETEIISMQKSPLLDRLQAEIEEYKARINELSTPK